MNKSSNPPVGNHIRKGISGSTLKIIAIISMLVDHTAAIFIERPLAGQMELFANNPNAIPMNSPFYQGVILDFIMRLIIGRFAFPIFCFLLVEGFLHTKDVKKYALRLFLFSILSEIPFDWALRDQLIYWGSQNVFFTLFIGLLTIASLQYLDELAAHSQKLSPEGKPPLTFSLAKIAFVFVGCFFAYILRTDYGPLGVLFILLLYLFRYKKRMQITLGALSMLWNYGAPLAFIPISLYNGKRGLNIKYFFYLFYPLHLLAFAVLAKIIL